MNLVTTVSAVVAMLGSALIAGVFFAFSSFVMKALARVPSEEGIAAMQSIKGWSMPSSSWLLAGALSYLIGTFLVTALGNVPLNDQLAAVSSADASAVAVWQHYLDRWTMLNTLRTAAAVAAAICLTVGLLQRSN